MRSSSAGGGWLGEIGSPSVEPECAPLGRSAGISGALFKGRANSAAVLRELVSDRWLGRNRHKFALFRTCGARRPPALHARLPPF